MKIISKSSVAGFVVGFICFPLVLWGGIYLYANFALDGFGTGGGLNPPELPAETSVSLDWTVKGLDGVEVNLKDYAQNKTVFLNFWATWCPPCVVEMPSIDTLHGLFGDTMAFVCISQENAETLKKFLQDKQFSFPVFYTETPPPQELNAAALPTTFIISSDGKILLKHVGGADWAHESVIAFLRERLARG
jgi:thiol-disulfide isomerase/thioredoxin